MPIALTPQFTQRNHRWTELRGVCASKRLVPQWSDDDTVYTVWGYDGPEVHLCTIWKGTVPDSILSAYSQEQNDADKADFEANFKNVANQPVEWRLSDGSPFVSPCLFPSGVYLYLTGSGDSSTERGAGDAYALSSEAAGSVSQEWSFLDWVLAAGGGIAFKGAELGDHVSLLVYAPATPVTSTPGTGNCNLVDPGTGAAILIVPATGGSHTVDLASCAPVPSPTYQGFFDWDYPHTGKGTVSLGVPQAAKYNLFTVDIPLVRFVNKLPILGAGEIDITIPAVEPKIILPHWKGKATLVNGGHTGLKLSWWLALARVQTT
jgi:hypothetical protein